MSTLRNIKRYIQAVRQNKGILQTDQIEVVGRSTDPSDANLANGRIYYNSSTDQLLAYINGSFTNLGAGAAGGASDWDTLYAADKSLTIDAAALTFNGTHATNDVFELTNATGSGDCLKLTNSGTGFDISGNSDAWSIITTGGVAVVELGSTATINAVDGALTIGKTGTATTLSGTLTVAEAVTATASLAITGSADTTVLTVTAGDVVITAGLLSLDDDDTATGNLVIPSSTAITGNPISVTADDLTTGAAIYVDSDNGASFASDGGFLNLTNGGTSVFKVQRYGSTVIAGNAGTTVLTLTDGDLKVTQGSITITADDDDAATLTATNDKATTASPFVLAGSGVFTGSTTTSFFTLTPSGLTTGTAMYLPMAAMTQGKGVHVIANALTSGNAVIIEQDGEALTSGELLTVSNVESGDLATITGNTFSVTSSLDETAGTLTADYDVALFSRTDKQSFAAQYDAQGSVVKILKTQNKAAGTIIDAVIGLEIESVSTGSALILGDSVKITSVGVNERSLNIVNACTGKDAVLVTASGILTDGLAGVNIVCSGDVATGGANLILTMSGTPNAGARAFEIDAQKDCRAMYIDTDSVTNHAAVITHSGNLATAKSVLHVTDAGTPAADDTSVITAAFTGTATNESRLFNANGDGKDVVGLYVDTDNTFAANSAGIVLHTSLADAVGVGIVGHQESATPAADDQLFALFAYGEEATSGDTMLYGQMTFEVEASTDGAIRGQIKLGVADGSAGASNIRESFVLSDDVLLIGDSAAVVFSSQGAQDLSISTAATSAGLAANEPKIVFTDGAAGNITVTAGGTSGEIDLVSPVLMSSTQAITGSGTINATTSITELDSNGGGAYGMDDGVEGQFKLVVFKTDPGTDAVITPTSAGGFTTHTMADAGDSVTMVFTNAAWYVVGQGGLAGGGVTA